MKVQFVIVKPLPILSIAPPYCPAVLLMNMQLINVMVPSLLNIDPPSADIFPFKNVILINVTLLFPVMEKCLPSFCASIMTLSFDPFP
ncbi:hypothetical protein [Methanobrevibacter arboriphilus]|uniref:hypothetical protein n=1 Tax=Methanobrevibacter arboriphilus TaxID=39441 RepID=UPI000ACDBFF2|nr:hypothetical protein [Methanobrevibacter arboriphilus]